MKKNILTQEVFVIENPGPKLLSFIEKMRDYKNKKIKETKREYIRSKFINDNNMNNTFYKYKNSIYNVTNINDKYKLHILTEKYPSDEVIYNLNDILDKLNNVIDNVDISSDVVIIENENEEIQVFTVLNNGTNGKEGNITNSMREIVTKIDKLALNKNVRWCTILDTHIDNIDDVYAWYLTFIMK